MRRAGSATAIETPAGGVSSIFALEGYDARHGIATYSLRVVNTTRSSLLCRIWIATRSGSTMLAAPTQFEVAPGSTTATQIPLVPRDYPWFERAIAEIAGDGIHCLVEAPRPVVKKPIQTYVVASAACVLFGLLALVGAAALRSAIPRIDAFAVPPETLAGTTVRAEYAASGTGRLSYSVLAPDGHALREGTLADSAGAIPISIPSAQESGAYTLQLVMNGPLGRAEETRVLNTVPAKARSASIENISVNPLIVKPGETATVAYAATGETGYVRLESTDGTVWSQQPFSSTGQTRFVIPPLAAGGLRVVLHVNKGATSAESVAGLVLAQASKAAAVAVVPAVEVAGDDDPNAPAASSSDENGTFELLANEVKSGAQISVKILSPRNGMRISVMDMQSREISGVDVGADADVVTLRAPVVSVTTRYVIQANFTDGFGQESVVQPITVNP